MNKKDNIIEINGRRYDVTTGEVLSENLTDSAEVSKIQDSDKSNQLSTLKPSVTETNEPKTSSQSAELLPQKSVVKNPRKAAKSIAGHSPMQSKTLMRHAVAKPTVSKYPRSVSSTDKLIKKPSADVAVKMSISQVNPKRLSHAKVIPKSSSVEHFKSLKYPKYEAVIRHETVNAANHSSSSREVKSPKTTADLLQSVLNQANSHEQPPVKPAKAGISDRLGKRYVLAGSIGFGVLLLIAVFSYQNIDNFKIHMASAKAGFSASLPSRQPSGFGLSSVSSSAGEVAAHFNSNASDQRNFTIVQKPSDWDSPTLRDIFVAPKDSNYQAVEASGLTIYLYGGSNATWVNGGIWYVITGNSSLSTQQLVNVATSL